jgi:uncharacterized lipoprotein YmbA
MRIFSFHMASHRALPVLFALLVAACQSSPSRLYVLSSHAEPSPDATVALASAGSSSPRHGPALGSAPVLGVSVTLPEYVDRTEIVRRVGANELKPDHDAQWGEDLSVDATRVIAEGLAARLSSFDVVMLPSRARRTLDYEVDIDLSRFESDLAGKAVARGWWTISDTDGHEVASGRVWQEEQANGAGYEATAASMSRTLMALSAEIANAADRFSRRDEVARN